jgi:hypothetical protein
MRGADCGTVMWRGAIRCGAAMRGENVGCGVAIRGGVAMRGGAVIRGGDAMRGGGEKCGAAAGRAGAAATGGFGLFCCAAACVNVNVNEAVPRSMARIRRANMITLINEPALIEIEQNRRFLDIHQAVESQHELGEHLWRVSVHRCGCHERIEQERHAAAIRTHPGPSPQGLSLRQIG